MKRFPPLWPCTHNNPFDVNVLFLTGIWFSGHIGGSYFCPHKVGGGCKKGQEFKAGSTVGVCNALCAVSGRDAYRASCDRHLIMVRYPSPVTHTPP